MKNLIVRSLSGIVYVGLIVAAVLCGQVWLCALLALFAAFAISELSVIKLRLIGAASEGHPTYIPYSIILDFLAIVAFLLVGLDAGLIAKAVPQWATIGLIAYLPLRLCAGLYEHSRLSLKQRVAAMAMSVMSTIYVGLAFMALLMLYVVSGKYLVLNIFILIWINDTGAYCFGSMLGKRKLWPELSPKKSWEGFWGGMLCCVAYSLACYCCGVLPALSAARWVVLAVVVSAFSTWGDLFESLLKRASGVKDSGHLIPGHGGILDRIDSLLVVAPAALALMMIGGW